MVVFKWVLIGVAALVGVAILLLGTYFWFTMKNAKAIAANVGILCEVQLGTPLPEVMQKALELGFQMGKDDFAVPAQISYTEVDSALSAESSKFQLSHPMTPEKVNSFKNGDVFFERSAFLFERHGCRMTFKDGQLTEKKRTFLD